MSKIIFICHPWRGNGKSHKDANYPELTKKICAYLAKNTNDIPLSTGLYLNQFLDDDIEDERNLGIKLGRELMEKCDEVYSYEMHDISQGMKGDLEFAEYLGKPIKRFDKYPWE
ncbi:hypothetical protein [Candidatus Nitrosotenuis cloacae]|uniref:DUF7768 domain-containing protein n=1 Tax=Candidatus Nitrosotenuis cloacae TaxID=1603555 RepID=UPI00069A89C2|nr:hypothetical protein [Candidatus Nitrosotenuis cloacae]